MASRMIPPGGAHGWLATRIDRGFGALREAYSRRLAGLLQMRPVVYTVWAVLGLLTVPLYMMSPAELAPSEDQGIVFTSLDMPANATLEQLTPYTQQVNRIWSSVPEFFQSFQLTFPGAAFGGALMKPWNERQRNIFQIQADITPKAGSVAGVRAPIFLPPALPSAGFLPVEMVIASTAPHEEVLGFAQQLVQKATESGQFAFPPMTDVRIDQAKAAISIDRDRAAAMGLDMQQLGTDLSVLLGGNFVNRFSIDGRSYKVIPQVERAGRLTSEDLAKLHISGPRGELMPLGSIAKITEGIEPRSLNRFQQLNAVKISGVAPRSVDQALQVLEKEAARILPPGYRVDYTGESRQLRQEGHKFLPALGLAVVLIFLALAAQFNSFRDPFVVLAGSVPLAMFGALIFTFLKFPGPPGMSFGLTDGWTTTLNIYSQVGLVTLVGLVAKNGILIVEFANAQQARGMSKLQAAHAAAVTRLRPILMTTVATVMGHFPLTLVSGPGASARNSIGIVLVGGMTIGTFFTLFVVPALYVLIAAEHRVLDEDEPLAEPPRQGLALPGTGLAAGDMPAAE
jgi:multidrug efflux pump